MLVFYTLEDRARCFILLFAGACLSASVYGLLQGAWPFGLIEAVWSAVALRKWRRVDLFTSTYRKSGPRRLFGVVVVRDRMTEEGHDPVADIPNHLASEARVAFETERW
jgi:hypothetical protein